MPQLCFCFFLIRKRRAFVSFGYKRSANKKFIDFEKNLKTFSKLVKSVVFFEKLGLMGKSNFL
ncbi:MAG: hypothetical protein CR982_05300 [Candidatus Cloacimonadota bacterium]|nr:MAG: hypothetical protein CR982_05300 [Candidatus Cloacimonadota bacterium]PIE78005.1 MAG: hypothetical protein CSA15_10110 [Candidatus Delongbacteria bacterium]